MTQKTKDILTGFGAIALVILVGIAVVGKSSPVQAETPEIGASINLSEDGFLTLVDRLQGVATQSVEEVVDTFEGFFGASGTRFPNGLSADSTSPSAGEVRGTTFTSTGAMTIGGALDVTGAGTIGGAFTQGGGVNSTSTLSGDNATTLSASDFDTENVIELSKSFDALTYTWPATSTLSAFAPNAGDVRTIWFHNLNTVAASTTIFVAGTGMDLSTSSSTPSDLTINGLDSARFEFIRKSNSDFSLLMEEFQVAD